MKVAIVVAMLANIGVAITKFVAFLFTGSSAMLAESLHSVADSGNEVLLLLGDRRARMPATREHQFGYGAMRYFNAFLVSVAIFTVGGLFSLYEGGRRMLDRAPVTDPLWAVGVLVCALVLEGISLRTTLRRSGSLRAGRGWFEFVRETKTPDLAVVLMEDLGAVAGLLAALIGVGLSVLTADGVWDGIATVLIGAMLIGIAVLLGRETRSLLIGEAASDRTMRQILAALKDAPAVRSVAELRTLQLSPDSLLVVAAVGLRHVGSAQDVVDAIADAQRRVDQCLRYECLVYLRPGLEPAQEPTTVIDKEQVLNLPSDSGDGARGPE